MLGRSIKDLLSFCGVLEVRLENVQHGGCKGSGQVRLEIGAHGVNRYAACDAETRLKRTGAIRTERSSWMEIEVRELATGVVDQLFHELRSVPEFVVHLRRGMGS